MSRDCKRLSADVECGWPSDHSRHHLSSGLSRKEPAVIDPGHGNLDHEWLTARLQQSLRAQDCVHIDIQSLPQMLDKATTRYLFVAIDQATCWVFRRVYADQSEASSVDYLERPHEQALMKITQTLTDNGRQFNNRLTIKVRESSEQHHFDADCEAFCTEHRLRPLRHPKTIAALVERFDDRVSGPANSTQVGCRARVKAYCVLQDLKQPHPATLARLPMTCARCSAQQVAKRNLTARAV